MKTAKTADEQMKALALKLLRAVDKNYSIDWEPAGTGYTWDGTGYLHMSEKAPAFAVHDVCHVLLASPSRRKLPEFGLGADPANSRKYPADARMVVSDDSAQEEENKTCALHWMLVAYVYGFETATDVYQHLSMWGHIPSAQAVRGARRHKGMPADFVDKVLEVREQALVSDKYRL